MIESKIIVALDFPDANQAINLAKQLSPELCRLKVGKELFTSEGPDVVKALIDLDYDIFLDLKFHDIPNTTAKACAAAAKLNVWMMNVHASGGAEMMEAARDASKSVNENVLLTAVTILTSLDKKDLNEIGFSSKKTEDNVLRLAKMAQQSNLDGVVCSPLEIELLRKKCGADFTLVTPGIRFEQDNHADQKRTMEPAQAISAGANYLVIGRPITQAENPLQALINING